MTRMMKMAALQAGRSKQMIIRFCITATFAAILGSLLPTPAVAQSISLRDSFAIGENGLCEAQILAPQPGDGVFDRRYSVLCRDASAPVGFLRVVRGDAGGDAAGLFGLAGSCSSAEGGMLAEGLPTMQAFRCDPAGGGLTQQLLVSQAGGKTFAASGVSVYSDALRLGLATLVADRPVGGEVSIPITQATDAAAFVRAQAAAISADAALMEAYRRSNMGNFAEAAEFFAASAQSLSGNSATEAQLNTALQQSNLGNYIEASRLFGATEAAASSDFVLARLSRNFQAIDALNRSSPDDAIAILSRPLPPGANHFETLSALEVDPLLAERLSAEQGNLLAQAGNGLTPTERAQLLDGQANFIRATALRQLGRRAEAETALSRSDAQLASVRDGRIPSILWLRAQVLAELAELAERRGDTAAAALSHEQAVALLEANYPGSPILLSARAQQAGLLARTGQTEPALAIYRDMVANADAKPAASLRRLLVPYFDLLTDQSDNQQAASDMFDASQLLLRPGLAQTQAILARELSGGSDEASQLFRRSVNLGRAVEKARFALADLEATAVDNPQVAARAEEKRAELEALQQRQLETQEALAAYPRYSVIADDRMTLADLQGTLRDNEAYVKLAMLEGSAFAIVASKDGAASYRIGASPDELENMVDTIRDSIIVIEDGAAVTYPFDIETSRKLYVALFGPVSDALGNAEHLIFEPDGAMLRLPINLLVMDDESVERYVQRVDVEGGDPYDFRDTAWLGKAVQVTTSVAPTSFRDVRSAPPSDARADYLGLGQNTPLTEGLGTEGGTRASFLMTSECAWAPGTWNDPIASDELYSAASLFGEGNSQVVVEDGFTDTALNSMESLDEYRIIHFATHGLVTAPRPACPARPALVTSFGDADSDGLLTFSEIYDLQIDADLVILSACDTAGGATIGTTREAGVTSGGDFALDGLVRAFVGAGGRSVVASHWKVPDDYDATKRLVNGLFDAPAGTGTAQAMRTSQLGLMDDPETSHPFYWAAFAIVGDGSIAVRR